MCSELHYDYVRLAWDAGFTFEETENKCNFNFNHLALVDVEKVSKERDVASVVKHISTILSFKLDDGLEKILEPTFIKVFRLSQLAIQYLQFCKKYLDGTVVILKKDLLQANQEKNKLSTYLEELKAENDKLREKNLNLKETFSVFQQTASFRCSECSKSFLSEEYLEAHIKRRHDTNNSQLQNESEKLQLEIKELKQRLNNTEKYIQYEKVIEKERNESKVLPNNNVVEDGRGDGLEEKFDDLRKQIESELKGLKDERFYGRLFEDLIKKLDNTKKTFVERGCGDYRCDFVHSGTQTEVNDPPTPLPRKLDPQIIEKKVEDCLSILESRVNTMCEKIDKKEEKMVKLQNIEASNEEFGANINRIKQGGGVENQDIITESKNEASIIYESNGNDSDQEESTQAQNYEENKKIKKYYVEVLPRTNKTVIRNENIKDASDHYINVNRTPKMRTKSKSKSKNFSENSSEGIVSNFEETKQISSKNNENKNKLAINIKKSSINTQSKPSLADFLNSNLSSTSSDSSDIESTGDVVVVNKSSKTFNKNISDTDNKKMLNSVSYNLIKSKIKNKKIKKVDKGSKDLKSGVTNKNKKNNEESKSIENNTSSNSPEASMNEEDIYEKKHKLNKIRKQDIQKLINLKLKSLGVAPHWNSLPDKSYKQANSIMEQEVLLSKKNTPKYSKKQEEILKIINATVKNSKVKTSLHNPSTSFESKKGKMLTQNLQKSKSTFENQGTPSKSSLRNIPQDSHTKKKVFFNLSPSGSTSSLLSSILDDNDKKVIMLKDDNKENFVGKIKNGDNTK